MAATADDMVRPAERAPAWGMTLAASVGDGPGPGGPVLRDRPLDVRPVGHQRHLRPRLPDRAHQPVAGLGEARLPRRCDTAPGAPPARPDAARGILVAGRPAGGCRHRPAIRLRGSGDPGDLVPGRPKDRPVSRLPHRLPAVRRPGREDAAAEVLEGFIAEMGPRIDTTIERALAPPAP